MGLAAGAGEQLFSQRHKGKSLAQLFRHHKPEHFEPRKLKMQISAYILVE
jgi:hypothetical protein